MRSPDNVNCGIGVFARVVAWTLVGAIIVLSVVPPTIRPQTPLPHTVEHFGIFFATGMAFGFAYFRRHVLLLMPLLVAFAGAVEVMQLPVPGRHARLSDFVVDASAGCLGAAVSVWGAKAVLEGKQRRRHIP